VLTTKQVSKNEIHVVCVSSLTIGKIKLKHLHFCNFNLWMPGAGAPFAPFCTPRRQWFSQRNIVTLCKRVELRIGDSIRNVSYSILYPLINTLNII